jgi:hypothetical protein
MLNIGLWGWGPSDYEKFIVLNRQLEDRLRELGGMKWLYSHTYYTEAEFWECYDRDWYTGLREKYNAAGLVSVYDKVHVDVETRRQALKTSWRTRLKSVRPVGGIWGIGAAIASKEYRIARNSTWKWSGER